MYLETRMKLALEQAGYAASQGEVPVGAVLFDADGKLLASAGNCTVKANDPCGHAEIRVLRLAAEITGNYRLPGTILFVTLEPCAMCAAALLHARVQHIVFGATDPKAGALISKYQIGSDGLLNHSFEITGGILESECSQILKEFFQKRR